MKIRPSLGGYGRIAAALLVIISGVNVVVGQQAVTTPTPPPGAAESSVEEGHTQMDESFDFRQWRLEKRRSALEDTKFEINLRTMFLDRNKFDGIESEAWAIGGWAGLKTGYFLDHIAFGVTGYTSQRLIGYVDRDGTLLLEPGQESFTVLGEAYADIRITDGLNLNIGRKGFDTPFINRNDTRMTPNTFEAIVLQGKVELGPATVVSQDNKDGKDVAVPVKDRPSLKYGIGYFDQIKERNSDDFVSMSVDAGATVERGVYAAGVVYEKGKFSIGAIDYYSDDIINIGYGETKMELPISPDWKRRLAAQVVDQRSVGDNLLQGNSFSTNQFGLKVELPVQKALFTVAFTHA